MNWLEQLRTLDINDIGRWPLLFRVLLIALLFMGVTGGGVYLMVVKDKVPEYERAQAKEDSLKVEFESKQSKAANLAAYKLQLEEMQREFGAMLRQLPGRTEVPSLLTDISQTGLAAGLEEKLFQPNQEVQRDFYAELPIRIRLTGGYHELGEFVSGIAALPRIVTLHDISISGTKSDNDQGVGELLELDVTAKTYRYLEEETEQ